MERSVADQLAPAILMNQAAIMEAIDPGQQAQKAAEAAAICEAAAQRAMSGAEVGAAAAPLLEKLRAMDEKLEKLEKLEAIDRRLLAIEQKPESCCIIS